MRHGYKYLAASAGGTPKTVITDNTFYALRSANSMAKSTDLGLTWQAMPTSGAYSNSRAGAASPNGTFVMTRGDTISYAYSTNGGVSWTNVAATNLTTPTMSFNSTNDQLVWDNTLNRFVAISYNSTSTANSISGAYSSDGITWTAFRNGGAASSFTGTGTYGNGRLLLGTGSSTIPGRYSTNFGSSWTSYATGSGIGSDNSFMYSPPLNRWINRGRTASTPNFKYSDDGGVTWTNNHQAGVYSLASGMKGFWSDVLGGFLFQETSGSGTNTKDRYYFSADGLTWSIHTTIATPLNSSGTAPAVFTDRIEADGVLILFYGNTQISRITSLTESQVITLPSNTSTGCYSGFVAKNTLV